MSFRGHGIGYVNKPILRIVIVVGTYSAGIRPVVVLLRETEETIGYKLLLLTLLSGSELAEFGRTRIFDRKRCTRLGQL